MSKTMITQTTTVGGNTNTIETTKMFKDGEDTCSENGIEQYTKATYEVVETNLLDNVNINEINTGNINLDNSANTIIVKNSEVV
jgi:hypothetical protein